MKKIVLLGMFFTGLLIIIQQQIVYAQSNNNDLKLGESEPLLEGTIWRLISTDDLLVTYEFRFGGRLVYKYSGSHLNGTNTFSWSREGDIIKIVGPSWVSEGKYYQQTQRIMLTQKYQDGRIDDLTFIPFQESSVTSVPSVPAPTQSSSTTNVYVQPSVPAQSPPSPTTSTPTLRTGRYACSGTNVTMELLPTTRFITLYSGSTTVGNGQYNINGNIIIITIIQASGVASSMQGKTYAYTIMSDTSFSGSGETWYRR